jgi:hypothetical protein
MPDRERETVNDEKGGLPGELGSGKRERGRGRESESESEGVYIGGGPYTAFVCVFGH